MLANKIVSPVLSQLKEVNIFKDTYVFEFLDLPKNYSEKDLRKALISNLKDFILELGKESLPNALLLGLSETVKAMLFTHYTNLAMIETFKPVGPESVRNLFKRMCPRLQ